MHTRACTHHTFEPFPSTSRSCLPIPSELPRRAHRNCPETRVRNLNTHHFHRDFFTTISVVGLGVHVKSKTVFLAPPTCDYLFLLFRDHPRHVRPSLRMVFIGATLAMAAVPGVANVIRWHWDRRRVHRRNRPELEEGRVVPARQDRQRPAPLPFFSVFLVLFARMYMAMLGQVSDKTTRPCTS